MSPRDSALEGESHKSDPAFGGGLWANPPRVLIHCAGIIGTLVIGYLDYLTGYEVSFFGFYFLSVGFAAWYAGRNAGLWASVFAAAVWLGVDWFSGRTYSWWLIAVWNAGMRLFTFGVLAFCLAWIRQELIKEHTQVHELKGLLPICAYCKKIRNDDGYWERIENYIKSHTEADFTHGICPECFEEQAARISKSDTPAA
ncbi:MAG TPA: hypothetical protein PKA41_05470 [Verrucomicrobiota bacterium]|nr:hypothetical protein [Verrucomicrobiota bacterium]